MTNTHTHREAWLHALASRLEPLFAEHGYPLPAKLRIACGFPSRRATGAKNRTIGQCWSPAASTDGYTEVMVSPLLGAAETMTAAGVLVHELVHAAVGIEHGHKGAFRTLALALGLEGRMTSTTVGVRLCDALNPILADIGPYPHGALNARGPGTKTQTTRLVKLTCPDCGYTVRTTRIWLDKAGAPICPADEIPMEEGA